MNLQLLNLKKAYSSDCDDILQHFYVPCLGVSIQYDRLAGFFSSTSLAVAARGILGLIKNGGTLRIIASPRLTQADVDAILAAQASEQEVIERRLLADISCACGSRFLEDHVRALGWMVANGMLQIKIAVPVSSSGSPLTSSEIEGTGMFHQKVGIFRDLEGNLVTFSGSVNETASAWLDNIEEFKVFRSWEPFEQDYVHADLAKFERFWSGASARIRLMEVPEAVRRRLVEIAPADVELLAGIKTAKAARGPREKTLFRHQEEAIESWLAGGHRGILEMATGTGKTFAALGCLHQVFLSCKKAIAVIACPLQHLASQWRREIEEFGVEADAILVADSSNPAWKRQFANQLMDITLGYRGKVVVLTTHHTLSSSDFVQILRRYRDPSVPALLIADEVHGMGAPKRARGLLADYEMRLGLSATPRRWFDEPGTQRVYEYFGGVVYEFTLRDAINTTNPRTGRPFLVPYCYKPVFVALESEELEEYVEKTEKIAARIEAAQADERLAELLSILLVTRADIVKGARGKYRILEQLLDAMAPSMRWTIFYCVPQQIDTVMRMLAQRNVCAHRFTMREGTAPSSRYHGLSQRDFILRNFADGKYQALVAMRCLDEGVDIPPARIAVLMASSGNPREYIQRLGRILRPYPGKYEATIIDIIVAPSIERLPSVLRRAERAIFAKELQRCEEIAVLAVNNAEALDQLHSARER